MITGGDAVYETLKAVGVDCVFGIPSQQNLGLYDALARHGDIRVIGTRHEQGAVHAADGYARATGRLGVAIVSTGPGTANAVSGLYEAGFASSPVLLIPSQVDTPYLGKGRGYIHEADGQSGMLQSVTRCTSQVRYADEISRVMRNVITDILTGRPQPGAVEIPSDLLLAEVQETSAEFSYPKAIIADSAILEQVSQRLASAKRPLLWVGGGCADAADEVRQLAEQLNCLVVSSINGRGVMPYHHPLYVGCQTHLPAFNKLLAEADLVLAIGTRFQAVASQYWHQPMPRSLIHVDIDHSVIGRNYPVEIAVVADAAMALSGILAGLDQRYCDESFRRLATLTGEDLSATVSELVGPDHQFIVECINRLRPPECPVIGDATTTVNTWGHYLLAVDSPRLAHYSTGLAIGPALAIALGAAIGTGQKTLAIHGDGGAMLNICELATAVQECAPLVVFVFNDGGYGVLKELQRISTGREYAVELHTPDFVALARAMGMPGELVASCEGFESALETALSVDGPYLIEVDLNSLSPIRMFA